MRAADSRHAGSQRSSASVSLRNGCLRATPSNCRVSDWPLLSARSIADNSRSSPGAPRRRAICRLAETIISRLLKSCATLPTRLPSASILRDWRYADSIERRIEASACQRSHASSSAPRRRSDSQITHHSTIDGVNIDRISTLRCRYQRGPDRRGAIAARHVHRIGADAPEGEDHVVVVDVGAHPYDAGPPPLRERFGQRRIRRHRRRLVRAARIVCEDRAVSADQAHASSACCRCRRAVPGRTHRNSWAAGRPRPRRQTSRRRRAAPRRC